MPNFWWHNKTTTAFFGADIARRYAWVHHELDSTASTTGPTHRSDPQHSIEHIFKKSKGDMTAVAVAKVHILTDQSGVTYSQSNDAKTLVDLMNMAKSNNANVRTRQINGIVRQSFSTAKILHRAFASRRRW